METSHTYLLTLNLANMLIRYKESHICLLSGFEDTGQTMALSTIENGQKQGNQNRTARLVMSTEIIVRVRSW